MKKEFLQGTAMFMAMLVVMIPIYSASVYAGLSNVEAKGSAGINGFVRENDYIDFKVYASIANDTITPNQVMLGTFFNFNSCTPGMNDFICALKYPAAGTTEFAQKSTPYIINLYDDSGALASAYSGSVTLDKKAPDLAVAASPSLARAGNITLAYSFTDPETTDSGCVGIGRINIYSMNGAANATIPISNASCFYAGEYKIEVAALADGEYLYYAQAFDRFDQASPIAAASFSVDKTGVAINASSLKIIDSNGNEINYAGSQPIPAAVSFSILAPDLDKSSVRADLSELNYNEPSYASLTASCGNTINNATQCSWSINILLNSSGAKRIYVNASDAVGNKNSAALAKSFVYDNKGPVATSLGSSYYWGNKYFVGSLNTFKATFTETSGLDKSDVYLDLTEIGSSVRAADSCAREDSAYTCYWNNVAASGSGAAEIAITQASKDIFGNHLNGSYAIDVEIDAKQPAVLSISITPIGGSVGAYGNYTKTGDSLQITANISEENYLAAKADFSAVISGNASIEGICNEEGSYWVCEWITMPIDRSGYISSNLIFNFTDIAGNSEIYSKPITVFEPINRTVDYWKHSLSCSPKLVDRTVTPLINQKVYCHVDLESGEAETISFIFDNKLCTGEAINNSNSTSSLGYLSNIEMFNGFSGSEDIYLKLTLAKGDMKISSLNFKCPVYIFSKAGNKVTAIPEEENVSIKIEFYNFPLGEYGDNLKNKIEDEKDFAFYIGDWVGTVDKLLNYGRKICQLYNTVLQVIQLYHKIGLLLSIIGKEFPLVDGTRTAQQAATEAMQVTGKKAWGEYINKFCKFMSCRLFWDDVWGGEGPGGDSIGDKIGDWQRTVLGTADWLATAGLGEIGGKSAYTTDYKNTNTGFEITGKASLLDPKDSIFLSLLTLCLPGIIYNLNKLRQIQCMYVDCLQNYATQGLPLKACEDAKHYAQCKYWTGEIFQLLPFTGLWNHFIGLVKQALSSPWGFVDIVLGYVCNSIILAPGAGEVAYVCLVNDIFGLIAEVWQDLEGIGEGWKIENDYCENI